MKRILSLFNFILIAQTLSCATVNVKDHSTIKATNQDDFLAKKALFKIIWGTDLQFQLSEMPLEGESSFIPYSASYLPFVKGGLGARASNGDLSTVEKYDLAFNSEPIAASWEKIYHNGKDSKWWEGHCDGWVAAATRHQEPQNPVIQNGITFTAEDIKNLLSEVYLNRSYAFLAGDRCHGNGEERYFSSRSTRNRLSGCGDTNPGDFHIALANWIGDKRHPFNMDIWNDITVENFPVYKYIVREQRELDKKAALSIIDPKGENSLGSAIFSPTTTGFHYFETEVFYINYTDKGSFLSTILNENPEHYARSVLYKYVVEINALGEIVGGEWVTSGGEELKNYYFPDFLWISGELFPSSSALGANPHIQPAEVMSLYERSIPADKIIEIPQIRIPTYDEKTTMMEEINALEKEEDLAN